MEYFIWFLGAGVIAGLLAGLFGVGGGLVIVPIVVMILQAQQLATGFAMQVALGTSLATIAVTGMSSVIAHHRRGAVQWPVFWQLFPGLLGGAFAGAIIADAVPSATLKIVFGIGELLVAIKMWRNSQPNAQRQLPGRLGMGFSGAIIGTISGLAGIGGGTLTVPFLVWCNVTMQRAVATAAAGGVPIAIFGTIGYIITGWDAQLSLPSHTGFIYWPAVLGIVATSVVCAPLGARLAHRLPAGTLKRCFAGLLAGLGIIMLWG